MSLNLALVISGEASGAIRAANEAKAAVAQLHRQAETSAQAMQASTAAVLTNDNALAQQAMRIAANGNSAAQKTALAAHEVTNLTRQFADLGVMLAGGQSPLMAMITQGPQISDIMGRRGLTQVIAGLGQGLLALATPTNLALLGITALGYGGSAIFQALTGDVNDANLSLEEQSDQIDKVARRWGGAIPALKAYNDELQRQRDLDDLRKASESAARSQYDDIRAQYPDYRAQIADATELAKLNHASSEQISLLQQRYKELTATIGDGTATGKQARDVQESLIGLVSTTGVETIQEYADLFGELARQIDEASQKAKPFRDDVQNLNRLYGGLPRILGGAGGPGDIGDYLERKRESEENERQGRLAPRPTPRPSRESEPLQGQDYLDSINERIERTKLEATLIGETDEVRRRAIASLEAEQYIRRQGIDTEGEMARRIREGSVVLAEATAEVDKHADAWRAAQKAGEDMIDAVLGKLAGGDWKGALEDASKVALRQLTDLLIGNPLKESICGDIYTLSLKELTG